MNKSLYEILDFNDAETRRSLTEKETRLLEQVENEQPSFHRVSRKVIYSVPLEYANLSVRAYNCLRRGGINDLTELAELTEEEALKIRNLGHKSLLEVKLEMAKFGLSLKPSAEE